jgi:hypothetical protein
MADGAEVRGVVLIEDAQRVGRHAVTRSQVPLARPVDLGGPDLEASGDGPDTPQRVEAHRDHLFADAVTRDDGEPQGLRYLGTFWAKELS